LSGFLFHSGKPKSASGWMHPGLEFMPGFYPENTA